MGRFVWPLVVVITVLSYLILVCLSPFVFFYQQVALVIPFLGIFILCAYLVMFLTSRFFKKKLPGRIDNKSLWLWVHWAFVHAELLLPIPLGIVGVYLFWLTKDVFVLLESAIYFEIAYIFSFYVFRGFRNRVGMDYRGIESSLLGASAFALLAQQNQWNRQFLLTSFRMADTALKKVGVNVEHMKQISNIIESTEYYDLPKRPWYPQLGEALLKLPDLEGFFGALESLKRTPGGPLLVKEVRTRRDWARIAIILGIAPAIATFLIGKDVFEKGLFGILPTILERISQLGLLDFSRFILLYLIFAALFLLAMSYWIMANSVRGKRPTHIVS